MNNWPFKYVNGEQTPESLALESLPPEKPKTIYNQCMETDPEDAPI